MMAMLDFPFSSVAEMMETGEAAIILPGPPIQILAQNAAPTIVLKRMQQHSGKFYYECKTLTGKILHYFTNKISPLLLLLIECSKLYYRQVYFFRISYW